MQIKIINIYILKWKQSNNQRIKHLALLFLKFIIKNFKYLFESQSCMKINDNFKVFFARIFEYYY